MHLPRVLSRCVLPTVLALTLSLARSGVAQQATTTGVVRGTVRAADASPIAGATIVAVNAASGTRRASQTDDRGRYSIPFLDPGVYTLRAQRIGFRPSERAGLRSTLGAVAIQDFTLETAATQLSAVVVNATSSSKSSFGSYRRPIATSRISSCSHPARATSARPGRVADNRSAEGARRHPTS
jgi:hypothetical protein